MPKSTQRPYSEEYWEKRYSSGQNSGAGSYGRLARFKAETVNKFIADHNIKTVVEFGAGDGNQLSSLKIKEYLGFDVSWFIVGRLKELYRGHPGRAFYHTSEYDGQTAELALSLDVIFHLVEDDVFDSYMDRLFKAAQKYVIIYSSNQKHQETQAADHFKHRKFTDWTAEHQPGWALTERIANPYPYLGQDPVNTSTADFYFYQKLSRRAGLL